MTNKHIHHQEDADKNRNDVSNEKDGQSKSLAKIRSSWHAQRGIPRARKHAAGTPNLPNRHCEPGDQENMCLFQKYQPAAQPAVLTKDTGGVGGRRRQSWGLLVQDCLSSCLHCPPPPSIGRAGCVCMGAWEDSDGEAPAPEASGFGGTPPLPRLLGPLLTMAYLR